MTSPSPPLAASQIPLEAGLTMMQDAVGAWVSACSAWSECLAQTSGLLFPGAILAAQAEVLARLADVGGDAAGERLAVAGLSAPLLSDA